MTINKTDKQRYKENLERYRERLVTVFLYISLSLGALILGIYQIKLNRELEKKNILLEQQIEIEQLNRRIIDIISTYNMALNKRDTVLFQLYGNKLERYFLKTNVDKTFIKYDITNQFAKKPHSRVLFDTRNITFKNNKGIVTVFVEKEFKKEGDESNGETIVTEMHFDKNLKIIYIRDYLSEK